MLNKVTRKCSTKSRNSTRSQRLPSTLSSSAPAAVSRSVRADAATCRIQHSRAVYNTHVPYTILTCRIQHSRAVHNTHVPYTTLTCRIQHSRAVYNTHPTHAVPPRNPNSQAHSSLKSTAHAQPPKTSLSLYSSPHPAPAHCAHNALVT
eukprot:3927181-Rhodomonas_salina.1